MMRSLFLAVLLSSLPALAGPFALTSKDLTPAAAMPARHVYRGMGCAGENLSPHLAWTDPPAGTRSFVVTVYDPDAPTGSGWWHWVLYNLPATVRELATGAGSGKAPLPAGALQGRTDFGAPGYGGACPPPGDKPHRYLFTVTALKVDRLDVPADATAAYVGFMTNANALGTASFTVTFERKK